MADGAWRRLEWSSTNRHDNPAGSAMEQLLEHIRGWESGRLTQDTEYALVATRDGELFERCDFEFQTTFEGWDDRDLMGAILSHTHRRGLPPSSPDVSLLLHLPKLAQFRVARFGKPTIVMQRPRVVPHAITAAELKRARMRTEDRRRADWSDEKRAEVLWEELIPVFSRIGIDFWEEGP